ncbi:collagen alpha-1(III) chain-like [Muntiacus reevesi]|uniref:collagen alpha-1(III) chain-like n=1 Tax=Muntiacus reevesi TaxID=9886 RepID=UPI0033076091
MGLMGARAGVNGFLSRLPGCGRPCEPDSGARLRPGGRQAGSELEEQRALGPRAGRLAETRAPGACAEDKACSYLRERRGYLPQGGSGARPREVTSGARRPEGGPARGAGGRGVCGNATPLRPRARGEGGASGGGAASHFRSPPPALFIFMRRGAGTGSPPPLSAAPRPAPRPRIPPRRRLRPQLSPTAGTKTAVGTPPYSTERETEAEDKARTSSPTSDGKEGLRPASNPRLRRPESGARASARPALPARSWNWAGRRNQGPRRGTAAALPAAPGRGGPGQGDPAGGRRGAPAPSAAATSSIFPVFGPPPRLCPSAALGPGAGPLGGGGPEDGAEEDARAARPRPGAPSLPVPAPRGRATLPSSPLPLPRPSAGSRPPPPPDAHAPPGSWRPGPGAAAARGTSPHGPAAAATFPAGAADVAERPGAGWRCQGSPRPVSLAPRPPPARPPPPLAPPPPPTAGARSRETDRPPPPRGPAGLACRRGLRDPGVASPASPRLAPGHCEPSPGPQRSLPCSLARALPPSPAPPAASLHRSLSSLLTSVCPEAGQSRGRAPGGSKLRQGSWAAAAGGALRGPLGWGWNPGWHLEALAHCPAQPGTQATAGQLAAGTPASLSLTGGEEVPQEARQSVPGSLAPNQEEEASVGKPLLSLGLKHPHTSPGWPSRALAERPALPAYCELRCLAGSRAVPEPCLRDVAEPNWRPGGRTRTGALLCSLLRKRGSEEEMRPAPASGSRHRWAAEEGGALGQSRVLQRFPGMRGWSALRPSPPDLAEAGPSPGLSFPGGRARRALVPPLRRGLAAPPGRAGPALRTLQLGAVCARPAGAQ